jgi:Ca2+-transporting ATPase
MFMEGNEHSLPVEKVLKNLETTKKGLTSAKAKTLLKQTGYNELVEKKKFSTLKLLLSQFKSVMVLILLFAATVSALLGEYIDATFITIIIILNAVLGFIQEFRAEKALESLKKLTAPHAIVMRDGTKQEILAKELVPGDIVFLDEGMSVPADARIMNCASLMIDESLLTGESHAIIKTTKQLKADTPIADRNNMIFMGSVVMSGSGQAVVTSTGMQTRIGKITEMVQSAEPKTTPLQRELNKLSKYLAVGVVALSFIIFILGELAGREFIEMFLITVSLAVSAIPEGLPAIVTVTLALGVQRMARKNAIVRKLNAAETLGSTNIICSDKTGTLTRNEMTATEYYLGSGVIEVTGVGYVPRGNFLKKSSPIKPRTNKELMKTLEIGVLCNNAELQKTGREWKILGDHTEGALLVSAQKAGVNRETLKQCNLVAEIPFTSTRKRMSKVYAVKNKHYLYFKGAPELTLKNCKRILVNDKAVKLTDKKRKEILRYTEDMSGRALRVLLLAFKEVKHAKKFADKHEKDLVFAGLVGMHDPPREGIKQAIQKSRTAGIRTIMITGDHAVTAKAIATEIGLVKGDVSAVIGEEIDKMSDSELSKRLKDVSVFARVSPEHKVRILKALKQGDNIVAMTGDGVNDAPALKNADIGVAMGLKGTDVAKNSSEMILLDDDYTTIVESVEEGRTIYDNLTKFIRFLLSGNFDELLVVGVAALMGLPMPLIALQILWLNLVTDGLPALALGVDPPEKNVMNRPPRHANESILRRILFFAVVGGFMAFLATFMIFILDLPISGEVHARTMAFTVSVVFELFLVFSARSNETIFNSKPFSNKYLILAVIASFILQCLTIYTPFLQLIFKTTALSLTDWASIILVSVVGVGLIDLTKFVHTKQKKHE